MGEQELAAPSFTVSESYIHDTRVGSRPRQCGAAPTQFKHKNNSPGNRSADEVHGGYIISVESEEGHASTFVVHLPRGPQSGTGAHALGPLRSHRPS